MRLSKEPPYAHGTLPKTGVLLVNLGTPDAPTKKALRRYLGEFLWDARVVEIPRVIWWFILKGIILNVRPKASAEKYATVWTEAGSPLRVFTHAQEKMLRESFKTSGYKNIRVESAMRYGSPSVSSKLEEMRADGCDKILVVPMYPQYNSSTTGSVYDAVFTYLSKVRNQPGLRLIKHFHDDSGYIDALAERVTSYWDKHGKPDKLVLSFHGVPKFSLLKGDPYHCECYKTSRLLSEKLDFDASNIITTFQSRFGRAEWLKPYTIDTIRDLGIEKTRRIDVFCPGFVADCLETLEEIDAENREEFEKHGGQEFHFIPCLNDSTKWIDALTNICTKELGHWLNDHEAQTAQEKASKISRSEALNLGASN